MQKTIRKNNIIAAMVVLMLVLVLLFTVSVKNVGAVNGQSGADTSNGSGSSNADPSGNATQKKLQGDNLTACQSRETVMNNVMSRIGDRGQKQIAVIESIQQKVQAFYSEKNISVSNYEALTANVEAKKQVATAAMNAVREMNGTFGCNGDDPKGVATQFKSSAAVQSDGVSGYKDAVHDLVTAIKTAVIEDNTVTGEN